MLRFKFQSVISKAVVAVVGAAAAAGLSASPAQAAIVGWNFTYSGGALNAEEVAGAPGYAQANWNNHAGNGQFPGAVPLALVDSDGNDSGVSIVGWTHVNQENSWRMDNAPTTPDETLMHSYASSNPTLTFSGLDAFAPDGYTVVVYYGREGPNPVTVDIDVNGSVQAVSYRKADSAYRLQGYMLNDGSGYSNYAVFENITGDVLTIDFAPGATAVNNFGITAVQIVAVPEPASLALIGLGGLLMLKRRHR